MTDYSVHELIRGAGLILDAATAVGIPMPLTVAASYGTVSLQVATPDDVKAWATWRGIDVRPLGLAHTTDRFVRVSGEMYEVPFAVYAVLPQLEHAGAAS